jgi:hypothetical protein
MNYQKGGKLVPTARLRWDGQITHVSDIIWPDGTEKIPSDYIMSRLFVIFFVYIYFNMNYLH